MDLVLPRPEFGNDGFMFVFFFEQGLFDSDASRVCRQFQIVLRGMFPSGFDRGAQEGLEDVIPFLYIFIEDNQLDKLIRQAPFFLHPEMAAAIGNLLEFHSVPLLRSFHTAIVATTRVSAAAQRL